MNTTVRYIGLDVHKATISIAVAEAGTGEAAFLKTIPYDETRLLKELEMLRKGGQELRVCYEAGPTGFGVHRVLAKRKISCIVVAPSLIPRKVGVRVKTDRRDSRSLAQYLRSGELTAVWVPDEATEALRDLERLRDDAKRAEKAAQQQLGKFLLRHGRIWSRTAWTKTHLEWISRQQFGHEAQQRVLVDSLKAVKDAAARVARLTKDIEELVQDSPVAPLAKALQAMRGISLVSAVVIAAEIGDLRRFATARHLMAFVGLVASEQSSGQTRRRGPLTRTGNGHVRRILIEAAWHYRHRPQVGPALTHRQEGVAEGVKSIAWKAQERLYRRLQALTKRGVPANKAVTAVARELAGFLWAIAQEEQLLAA